MPNDFLNLSDAVRWSILVGAIKTAAEELGYRLTRLPGRGRSNVWQIEKNGENQRACFRTTQDRWIAFPPLNRGAAWKTLDNVDIVFVAAVDDRDDPEAIEIFEFSADEVRERFDAAYAARTASGQVLRDNFGMWISLDPDRRGIAASTGSGLADIHQPVATYPIATIIEGGAISEEAHPGEAGGVHDEAEPVPQPATIAEVLASSRRKIAAIAGVQPEKVKLDVTIEISG